MKRSAFLRIFVVASIGAAALSFQNCGPTFVRNEAGEIQYSSFEGPIEIPNILPSEVRSDYPSAMNGRAVPLAGYSDTARTSNCGSTMVRYCDSGVTLSGSKATQ